MHTQVKQHFFNKWPKTSVALLVFAAVATIDISLGWMLIPSGAMTVRRPHHFYHHGLKPSRRAMAHWGDVSYPLVTNSLGLRDGDTRELLFQTERYRILFMGDSFTEGVGVPFQQTFAGILEAQLKAKNVDVLNGGCIGYSPKLYYLKTKYLLDRGLKVNELVVLIDLSDIPNEVELYREFEPTKSIALRALALRLHVFLKGRSYAYYAVNTLVFKKRNTAVWDVNLFKIKQERLTPVQQVQDAVNHPAGAWPENKTPEMQEGLRLAVRHMQQLVALCRDQGIRVRLVIYPWPRQLFLRQHENVHVRVWRRFARENSIEFIDLFNDFLPPGARPDEAYKKFFILGDVHWSAAGHQLVAKRLLPVLAGT